MKVVVVSESFNPWQEIAQYHKQLPPGQYGGTAVFVGTMRDFNDNNPILEMTLEHYPGMTESHLEKICQQAIDRWHLIDAMIIHRVGNLLPDDPIVLVAAWSAHRKEAFEAGRYIIEDLKHSAPFWKKEKTTNGARWVETNTPS